MLPPKLFAKFIRLIVVTGLLASPPRYLLGVKVVKQKTSERLSDVTLVPQHPR